MNKKLKIRKEFAEAIFRNEKNYEVRKLEKGLAGGTYDLISLDGKTKYGEIIMQPFLVNPDLNEAYCFIKHNHKWKLDKETWTFARENYWEKNIDFVVYKIKGFQEETDEDEGIYNIGCDP